MEFIKHSIKSDILFKTSLFSSFISDYKLLLLLFTMYHCSNWTWKSLNAKRTATLAITLLSNYNFFLFSCLPKIMWLTDNRKKTHLTHYLNQRVRIRLHISMERQIPYKLHISDFIFFVSLTLFFMIYNYKCIIVSV